jgi:hypothetical protein
LKNQLAIKKNIDYHHNLKQDCIVEKLQREKLGFKKKEIIFTGDVLNTTARIEGLCNQYNVDILLSSLLTEKLDLNTYYKVDSVGKNTLRTLSQKVCKLKS